MTFRGNPGRAKPIRFFCAGWEELIRFLAGGGHRGKWDFNLYKAWAVFPNENALMRWNVNEMSLQLHSAQEENETDQIILPHMWE